MEKVIEKITKLIDVKTLISLSWTWGALYLLVKTGTLPEQANTLYSVIIGFYFGTQYQKKTEDIAITEKEM